jgi:hypothetical protein
MTPTLCFAMNTRVLHQTLLHESGGVFGGNLLGLKKWLGTRQTYTHEDDIGGRYGPQQARICLGTDPSCGVLSDRERIGTCEQRPIAGLI